MTPPSGQRARARPRPLFGRSRRALRGQALVELALIIPILLFLLLGALDLGRVFYANITVASAAKEAALRASAGASDWDTAAVNESRGGFVQIAARDVSAAYSDSTNECSDSASFGATVTATVDTPFTAITPYVGAIIGGQTITLTSVATAHCAVLPTTAFATPTPTPGPTPTMCTVPNILGQNYLVAATTISNANLTPSGSQTNGGGNQKGQVASQNPAGGLLVSCGSTVSYLYYKP